MGSTCVTVDGAGHGYADEFSQSEELAQSEELDGWRNKPIRTLKWNRFIRDLTGVLWTIGRASHSNTIGCVQSDG